MVREPGKKWQLKIHEDMLRTGLRVFRPLGKGELGLEGPLRERGRGAARAAGVCIMHVPPNPMLKKEGGVYCM